MVDLKSLLAFLKIVSLIGLIAMDCMMTAVLYKKLKEKYPVQVEEKKWIFVLVAALMMVLMFFLYNKFIA